MSRRGHRQLGQTRRVRAFTLVEVLLALALTALVMVGLNTFIFSMGELWGRNVDQRLFDQHVRAVSRYLEAELRSATLPPAGRAVEAPLAIQETRTQNGTENLLTFELPEGSRLLTWPERPLPEVVCALTVRSGVGLVLLWHSRLEKNFNTDVPREALVTPLVTALSYDYYESDFRRWKTETTVRRESDGTYTVPGRLRLVFTYGNRTQEALISLATTTEGLPPI